MGAQISADKTLAAWKRPGDIFRMPATKGTKARTTAVKRAKKTLAATNPLIPPLKGEVDRRAK
jgi:hypothetical protein